MTKHKHRKRRVRARAAKTGERYTAALRHLHARAREAPDMPTTEPAPLRLDCSFCGKPNDQVRKLVAGPGVHICDECIALCHALVEEGPGPASEAVPPLEAKPVDALVGIFAAMARAADRMEANLHQWAGRLQARGVTVGAIAEAAGITEDEARGRFDL